MRLVLMLGTGYHRWRRWPVGWGPVPSMNSSVYSAWTCRPDYQPPGHGGVVNIPSIIVVLMASFLLLRGASRISKVNTILVFTKIAILIFFCAIAFTAFQADNLFPFIPLGISGVTLAAAQVFFSFIGFDTAATAGEEAKNPLAAICHAHHLRFIIVTTLYVVVALAAIGAAMGAV